VIDLKMDCENMKLTTKPVYVFM